MNSVCKSLLWLAVCLQLLFACLVSARPQNWEDGIAQYVYDIYLLREVSD